LPDPRRMCPFLCGCAFLSPFVFGRRKSVQRASAVNGQQECRSPSFPFHCRGHNSLAMVLAIHLATTARPQNLHTPHSLLTVPTILRMSGNRLCPSLRRQSALSCSLRRGPRRLGERGRGPPRCPLRPARPPSVPGKAGAGSFHAHAPRHLQAPGPPPRTGNTSRNLGPDERRAVYRDHVAAEHPPFLADGSDRAPDVVVHAVQVILRTCQPVNPSSKVIRPLNMPIGKPLLLGQRDSPLSGPAFLS
jgi:hypothetical protein